MSSVSINHLRDTEKNNKAVKALYEKYAKKLLVYTCKNYGIAEDVAMSIVYKTIYKIAGTEDKYTFGNKHKEAGFVFKTHINYLKNYFRDDRTFENKNVEVELDEEMSAGEEAAATTENLPLKILQRELDKLQEWERILVLMRGQEMPYSEIAAFVDKPEKQLKVYYARIKKLLLENVNNELQKLNASNNAKK